MLWPNYEACGVIANANKKTLDWQYQYLLNPKDTLAGGGTIDFDLKGKDLKEAIYANSVMVKVCEYNKPFTRTNPE